MRAGQIVSLPYWTALVEVMAPVFTVPTLMLPISVFPVPVLPVSSAGNWPASPTPMSVGSSDAPSWDVVISAPAMAITHI